MKWPVIFLILFSCVANIFSLKLLLVFPPPTKSHYTLGNELGKGLARAGHDVTMISSFEDKNPPKGYKEIVITELAAMKENMTKENKLNIYEMENIPAIFHMYHLSHIGVMISNTFFEIPKIKKLLSSSEHFDAVIIEQFSFDAIKFLAHHFKAHLIIFSSTGSNKMINNAVGNPAPPSYVPDIFLSFTGNMNFFERTYNLLFGTTVDLLLHFVSNPRQDAILKRHYPNAPDLTDLQSNVSLVLLNSHESVNEPVPRVPNMIDIGGFHINPLKELPRDLKEFMDNAKDGVIYFSMGSNLVPSQMPQEKKDALLKVLGERKEKVLWKWDEDTLKNKPDNMMISKWFPQQAILAHPNCKLFITHGGLGSTTETVYLGVPVLAIPIFGDQKLNAARAASLGYGKSLPFSQISENKLAPLVAELLENPSYRENVKTRSKIMRDRPVKPMDSAIYWIEYVVRHNGAPHLRVAGISLPFYKYYMLDIIATLLGALMILKYVLLKVCRCMCNSKRSKNNEAEQSKLKKKRV